MRSAKSKRISEKNVKKLSNKPRKTRFGTGVEVVKHSEGQELISLTQPSEYREAVGSLRMLRSLGVEDLYLFHSSLFKEVLQLTPAQVKRVKKAQEEAKKDDKKS